MSKFLSLNESREWLSSLEIKIDQDRLLMFPSDRQGTTQQLIAQVPENSLKQSYFLERVVDWLPHNSECLLWIADWATYPPYPLAILEALRRGCGEHRQIVDAPGCLFEPLEGAASEELCIGSTDNIGLVSLSLLVAHFNWQAYLVARDDLAHIHFRQTYISFCSSDNRKVREATALARQFKLKIREPQ